ncbi:MAG: hypothetical protein H0W56_03135 [Acidothermales bacterium]|nr:hypothetical protein [Acidothermales bacterium]
MKAEETRAADGVALMWHVTVTLSGSPLSSAEEVCAALQRLTQERPFLLSCRYATDRAELQYWEEARELEDAAALALRLWGEHRLTAALPPWHVVGLQVVDRQTYHLRTGRGTARGLAPLVPAGRLRRL